MENVSNYFCDKGQAYQFLAMRKSLNITPHRDGWIRRKQKLYGRRREFWIDLLDAQGWVCALSKAPMRFDVRSGRPPSHPLYASVDHKQPRSEPFQIICYELNDLKGHMPPVLFDALTGTKEWDGFMKNWRQAELSGSSRKVFRDLIQLGRRHLR